MKLVFICSPFSAPDPDGVIVHMQYARRAMLDSINRGEAPYVPHLLYTQVLEDNTPEHREYGTEAAFVYLDLIKYLVVYTDFGISKGMKAEIERAEKSGYLVEYRRLP